MSVITGYIGGPPATGQAIQVNTTPQPLPGQPRSVVLNCSYYPVPCGNAIGDRPSLSDYQPMPRVIPAGTCITVSAAEAAALIAANVAMGV
jgi:hypothetical protein